MRLLAISGSLRRDSHNTRLLRHIAEQAPAGVDVEFWEGLRWVPPYDQDYDTDPAPPAVAELRAAIADAGGLIIATPEYNSSLPGALKNALDWASRPRVSTPLQGKPAAVVSATTGQFGAVWAQSEVRKVLASTGARVVDQGIALAKAHQAFDENGSLLSEEHVSDGRAVIEALMAEIATDNEPVAA